MKPLLIFIKKISKILNLIIANLTLTVAENNATVLIEYLGYSLRILLRHLKEPLGPLMWSNNPKDPNEALGMLTNEFQDEIINKKLVNYYLSL